jgi:ABC-type branched-subunit amino acid transport system substrate-binding protein
LKRLAAVLLTALLLTAFSGHAQTDGQKPDADNGKLGSKLVLTIGCLLPLTGKYRVLGEQALKGILAGAESAPPGVEYEVVVKDIGDSGERLTAALDELLSTPGLAFIVGPVPSKFIQGVSSRVNSERIPMVVFPVSEDDSTGGPYIIKFYYPLEEQVRVLSRYATRDLGIRNSAVLYPKTELGIRMKELFASGVSEYGGRLVYEGSYDPESIDISGDIGWISSVKPEAIFIPDGAAASAELILRLKRNGKIRDVLFLGPSTWNSPLFLKLVGNEIDGFVYRAIFTDMFYYGEGGWEEFSGVIEAKFKERPDFFEYQNYRAVKLMLSLLQQTVPDKKELTDTINSLKNDPDYDIKRDLSGSIQLSPSHRILSVSGGKLIDIMKVQ